MNRAEIKFDNEVLADILHISDFGKYSLKFDTDEIIQPPRNSVDVLSMLFALLEKNPETPAGRVYTGNQAEILHRTMSNLSAVINAFGNIEVTIIITSEDEEGNIIETKSVTNIAVSETETKDESTEE
ncbi:MAG: hypothetical protein NC205_07895 [Prevotella sp.]|nr:hypothetical protein [Alistipes senegalensis]MCM1358503.1 hypothetical protein [Prevotella sp.]